MTNTSSTGESASLTAQISPDAMGLGRTSGQRTAEMVAGFRYELKPTPLNIALSRFSGRLVARMIMNLMRDKSQINYILARPATFKHLTDQYIAATNTKKVTLVEIAAGFSPRGFEYAQERPQTHVIEIDLPDVVEEKQRRLAKAANISMPPNLKWYKADLGVEALADVLQNEKVDIVSAEGLNPYFSHADITRIAKHIKDSLKPGGVYISDVGWDEARHTEQSTVSLFSRQASTFLGTIKAEEEGRQLFVDAGYGKVDIHRPTKITAEMADIPTTPQDYSVIFVAHNVAASASKAAETPATATKKPESDA